VAVPRELDLDAPEGVGVDVGLGRARFGAHDHGGLGAAGLGLALGERRAQGLGGGLHVELDGHAPLPAQALGVAQGREAGGAGGGRAAGGLHGALRILSDVLDDEARLQDDVLDVGPLARVPRQGEGAARHDAAQVAHARGAPPALAQHLHAQAREVLALGLGLVRSLVRTPVGLAVVAAAQPRAVAPPQVDRLLRVAGRARCGRTHLQGGAWTGALVGLVEPHAPEVVAAIALVRRDLDAETLFRSAFLQMDAPSLPLQERHTGLHARHFLGERRLLRLQLSLLPLHFALLCLELLDARRRHDDDGHDRQHTESAPLPDGALARAPHTFLDGVSQLHRAAETLDHVRGRSFPRGRDRRRRQAQGLVHRRLDGLFGGGLDGGNGLRRGAAQGVGDLGRIHGGLDQCGALLGEGFPFRRQADDRILNGQLVVFGQLDQLAQLLFLFDGDARVDAHGAGLLAGCSSIRLVSKSTLLCTVNSSG
jgi:hypothetical protein